MKIGKVSESILTRSVLNQLKTKRNEVRNGAGIGGDCAIFAYPGGKMISCIRLGVFSRDIFGGEQEFMDWLVTKCVNNLAASGAEPVAAQIGLMLPESTEEPQIQQLMKAAERACSRYHMQIAGGQTEVCHLGNAPYIAMTGYGKVFTGSEDSSLFQGGKGIHPGQDIVLSKWIGLEGTAAIAEKKRDSLLQRYPAFLVEEAIGLRKYLSVLPEAAVAMKSGVCGMHDASEGGIFAAFWELAERAGVGLSIELKKLPLKQETVEVCEYCNINPYELMSGGSLLMVARDGNSLVRALEKEHIPAVVVGRVTQGRDRIVCNEDEIRYLERPRTDEIYKIFH